MKKITLSSLLTALFFVMVAGVALAHNSTNTISAPSEGQEFVVVSLPANIVVEGMIVHGPSGTINGQKVCVIVGFDETCEPDFVGGLGSATSRNYNITIAINTPGPHTIQASNANSDGDHAGLSDSVDINIVVTSATCDEVDPPAWVNQYLNDINPPKQYAKYRGQIIRVIAFNHSIGEYGSCTFNYDAVKADVDDLLENLGFSS
jgi:hypothetical protein